MAPPTGLRTVQQFAKSLGRAAVDAQASADTAAGAVTVVTEDADNYVLTVDWPAEPADPAASQGDAAAPLAAPVAAAPTPAAATPGDSAPRTTVATRADGGPPDTDHALAFASAIVQHWESCSLVVYHGGADRPNVWTIGWGCIAINGTPVNASTPPITQDRADGLLTTELSGAQAAVGRQITMALTEFQEAALISFTYNLGEGKLAESTLRTLLNGGHVNEAAAEFLKWVMSNGQQVKGLVRRRGAEQAVFQGKVPFNPQLGAILDQFGDEAWAAVSA